MKNHVIKTSFTFIQISSVGFKKKLFNSNYLLIILQTKFLEFFEYLDFF